jgi:hypothetical protein
MQLCDQKNILFLKDMLNVPDYIRMIKILEDLNLAWESSGSVP